MRLLSCNEQPDQPVSLLDNDYREEEDSLVRFDIDYFVCCIDEDRKRQYKVIKRPDLEDRQNPRPDYLIEDSIIGHLIAVEYARFFESEEDRESEATKIKRLDKLSSAGSALICVLKTPTPKELGERISQFILGKLSKRQFQNYGHCERILLARNRWAGVRVESFFKSEPYLKLPKDLECDHFYIIVSRKLLEVF